jgi:AcrR family transcriptional regulator
VIYKYYENKEALFLACVRRCIAALERVIDEVAAGDGKILDRAEKLIRAVLRSAREQRAYNVLYHEITAGSCRKYAPGLAAEIEGVSARAYTALIGKARAEGDIRRDMDPRLFAFFFDSLLMMLQFSLSCDYYQERFRIYCGGETLCDDGKIVAELLKFFESAFTTEQSSIGHRS